jgi:ParB family chromosome partitioning protein
METQMSKPRSKTAIQEQRSTTFMLSADKPLIIGFDTKHKQGQHPLWQERALEPVDEALAQSMAVKGFTSVIQVRTDGDTLEVVAGRRRVKAARRANEIRAAKGLSPIKIEAKVVRGLDLDMVALMISENSLRKDVAPLAMAVDLQNFLNMGASEEEAATAAGKSVTQLRAFLKLLDLAPQVQDAVRKEKIAVKAAISLASLGRDEQIAELAKIESGESGATVADVDAAVRAKKQGESEVTKAPGKRLINKLLASDEGKRVLSAADGVQVCRWMLGELNARNIKGLVEAIRFVSGK